ncbi:MAG: hypothetical protein ING25_10690 [Burkholderiales bacterium]|nr:hypothetical protein [Burkholderiales bacterium]
MQGTPEQVIPNLTQVDDEGNPMPQAIKPAQPQNIPAAFRALSTSPDAAMRQFAQQGAMQFAQKAAEQRRAEQDRQRLMGILQNSTPQQAIAAGVPVDLVKSYYEAPNIGRAEVARTVEITGANGEKLIQQLDKAGQPVGAPMPAYNAPMQINTGGAIELVAPKAGQRFAVGMSPSERDASARGWANVRQGQERLEIDKTKTTPNANVTEGERKAATLLQRMQNSEAQLLKALEGKKSAEKPGIVPSLFRGVGLETMANLVTPENRQQAEAAQLDILDAALTLGTGAAYTKEQLEGYRKSYFPQIGDRPETIRDKQARLNNVLSAARIAAGRSAGQVIAPQQPAEMPPGFEVIR